MKKQCPGSLPGVITIFCTLLLTVFLSLFFALAESVRIQGARMQAANATDLAGYSLFSEYEKQLLTDYELFAVDCSYGSGGFTLSQMGERFRSFLEWNEKPAGALEEVFCFDPWQVRLTEGEITKAALLSDRGGCGFYDQAVAFMKETAVTTMAGKLYECYGDAQKLDRLRKSYEETKEESDGAMADAQSEADTAIKESKKNGVLPKRPKDLVDPLRELAKLVREGIFESVLGDVQVSDASVSGWNLASHRMLHAGTLKLKKENGGLADDLLFREYLLDHFPNFLEKEGGNSKSASESERAEGGSTGEGLRYQTEYLIAGKKSDRNNLKSVVRMLVLLREGANYSYCSQDAGMNAEAETLALLLTGWTGLPQLMEVTRQALLLGWAYGESLLDARTLLTGGRVPLMKDASSWQCSLDQIKDLPRLLRENRSGIGEGLRYRDYLRLLLNLRSAAEQEKRGLDLVEMNLQNRTGNAQFRVDQCVVAVKNRTEWEIPPVFFRIVRAFSGLGGDLWATQVEGGFAYR